MTSTAAACELCGLDCEAGTPHSFCCSGCANVYAILVQSGARDFRNSEIFRRSLEMGLISTGARARESVGVPEGTELREALYRIDGMWCGSCAWLISHALGKVRGVVSADVQFATDLLKIRYAPQYVPVMRIVETVASLGYHATEFRAEDGKSASAWRDLYLRLGVAGFLWLNVMTFSTVIYASYFEAITESARRYVPVVLMLLTAPVVFYSAMPIHRLAWAGARQGVLRVESLLSLGILAAFGYSAVQAAVNGPHYYFDTACAIVTLLLVGKVLEREAKDRTSRAVLSLYRLMPRKALVEQDGREHYVSVDALRPGQVFIVKPGERIPADGLVVEGESAVDESVLTGESQPRLRVAGDPVVSGSSNTGSPLKIRATRTGSDSTLTVIVQSVERALSSRTGWERTADRLSRWFVPAILATALAGSAALLVSGLGTHEAIMRGLAVIVISCPCALGIATPLAITAAVGQASRKGILIGDLGILERVRDVDLVVFDKTGTATEGRFELLEIDAPQGPDALLARAAAIERYSEHPIAKAIVSKARERGLRIDSADRVAAKPGAGIEGWTGGEHVSIRGGQAHPEWERKGYPVVEVLVNGVSAGAMGLGDRIRPEMPAVVEQLRRYGVRTALLSGDSPHTTSIVAARLGVDEFRAGVMPEGKAAAIAGFKQEGRTVAMVGDGVNDAPALAVADLGIAMGTGADLAMNAASVVLMSGSMSRVLDVFDIARRTLRVIRQNLFWAFFYNVVGVTLALAGVLHPVLAAVAMSISGFTVVANSLRLQEARYIGRSEQN